MLMPLTFVITVSMLKDIFEDYKRHKSDNNENLKQTLVYDEKKKHFQKEYWQNLKVGMVVKVVNEEFFPADMVFVKSSDSTRGVCYMETKNLDGETNLKHKIVEKHLNYGLRKFDPEVDDIESFL